jgi:hypothetical protein
MKKQTQVETQVQAMKATRGPAINVRPGGIMQSRNTRRNRTRADQKRRAIADGE